MNSNSVDPKEVLKLMNGLGYKNITANELKEFTKGKQIHFNQMKIR